MLFSCVRFGCAADTGTGWKAIYHCTLPGIRLIGSQISQIYNTTLHHSSCRAAECSRWNLRAQPTYMARNEDCTVNLWLLPCSPTLMITDCAINFTATDSRSLL